METTQRPLAERAAARIRNTADPIVVRLDAELAALEQLSLAEQRLRWHNHWGRLAPAHLPRSLLSRVMAYRLQAEAFGDLDSRTVRLLGQLADGAADKSASPARLPGDALILKPGALLTREWQGRIEPVMVVGDGFAWNGTIYPYRRSLTS